MLSAVLAFVLLLATSGLGQGQALIDYHQHLLMPTEQSGQSFTARDLIKVLDDAKIRRALVLSMAYRYGNPNRPPVPNEYAHVKAENDWVSQQVALYPDRLRAFCGVDPLKDYALEELARCAKDRNLRYGVKMHFGNSDVDLDNPDHIEKLRRVFRWASVHNMAIVVHMHPSVSMHRPYGSKEARTFLTEVLPSAKGTAVQIAHFAGAGGYDDPAVDDAMVVFVEALEKKDPNMKSVYFDATSVAGLGRWRERKDLIVKRARQVGISRVLFGSDGNFGAGTTPSHAWADLRALPFTDAEFRTIERNFAPYMR